MMVSYVRARAEGLGIECKGGFMQRPERVVTIGTGALLCGIFTHYFGNYCIYLAFSAHPIFEPILILVAALATVAVFSNITAIGRLNHCRKVLTKLTPTNYENQP
jgi:CDP-diacylglycerol--glycerol-3-phosphate 3-phosphatidyltransferase